MSETVESVETGASNNAVPFASEVTSEVQQSWTPPARQAEGGESSQRQKAALAVDLVVEMYPNALRKLAQ